MQFQLSWATVTDDEYRWNNPSKLKYYTVRRIRTGKTVAREKSSLSAVSPMVFWSEIEADVEEVAALCSATVVSVVTTF